ncbi:hypothetical protein Mapa_003734 [Marchantia paleacea]|nr:hypothetical protein Mapa_003734 [Marchantia paleacea]
MSIFGRYPQILKEEFGQNSPSSSHGVQHACADLVRLPVIVVPQAIRAQVVIQIPRAVVELCRQERQVQLVILPYCTSGRVLDIYICEGVTGLISQHNAVVQSA